jgi:solute carrier family 15 (peptide/histidine transporter), member 3/4
MYNHSSYTSLLIANECCERLAYYGMSTNLVNFMKNRLNEGNAAAANIVTNWSGTCYITPLIGAFLADAYLGRFSTISIFMMIYIVVSTLITVLDFSSIAIIGGGLY